MVQFGRELAEHTASSDIPAKHYVNYSAIKKALKNGVSDADLQEMYVVEMHKIIGVIAENPKTLKVDPQYLEINRKALDKISKKLDKQRNLNNRRRNRELATRHLEETFNVRASKLF